MNKVILIGRLTKDPELRFTPNGSPFCGFTLAVNRPTREDGSRSADFINCQVWGSQAENLAKYTSKGRQIAVEGSIRVDSSEENGERKWYTKVSAFRIEYLGSVSKESDHAENGQSKKLSAGKFGTEVSFSDEDLPF